MLIKGSVIKADAAVASARAKSLFVRAAAAALAIGLVVAIPGPSQGAEANVAPATKASLDQTTTYSAEQAASLSLQPVKRLVFHYDVNLPEIYKHSITGQAERLRTLGYHVVALPGGPTDSVKVYISGKTSDKLVFGKDKIITFDPSDYGVSYYQKLIGQPESKPVDVAGITLDRL